MSRMPQKLLVIGLFVSILTVWGDQVGAVSFKLKASLEKDSNGVSLHYPLALYFDQSSGRLYVTDTGNNRLVSYDRSWNPLKEFDAAGQLKGPLAMVRDKGGSLWVVERPLNSLTFIDLKAQRLKRHQLSYQGQTVLVDRLLVWKKNLVVLDRATGQALLLGDTLKIIRSVRPKNKDFKGFFDIKIKGDWLWGLENISGRIYGLNLKTGEERIITPEKKFSLPVAIEIDKEMNFYILDRYLKKVFVFDKKGRFRYSFLEEGATPGHLSYPWQLLFVGNDLLVLDEGNGRIDIWGH
ncbi:hypothetical protein [Thermosulfuriphilus sp.]